MPFIRFLSKIQQCFPTNINNVGQHMNRPTLFFRRRQLVCQDGDIHMKMHDFLRDLPFRHADLLEDAKEKLWNVRKKGELETLAMKILKLDQKVNVAVIELL